MTEIVEADKHLMEFMKAQVRERKAVIGSIAPSEQKASTTQTDAFTMLVEANEDEGGKFKLDDEELVRWTSPSIFFFFGNFTQPTMQIGNIFIMLFAGHGN